MKSIGVYGIKTKTAKQNREQIKAILEHGPVVEIYKAPSTDKTYRNKVFTFALRNKHRLPFFKSVVDQVVRRKRKMTDAQFFAIERIMQQGLQKK